MHLSDTVFNNNTVIPGIYCDTDCAGGAIYNSGSLDCERCTFSNNCAEWYSEIHAVGNAIVTNGNTSCSNCSFFENTCVLNDHGWVLSAWLGKVSIVNSNFFNNTGTLVTFDYLQSSESSSLTIDFTNCTFDAPMMADNLYHDSYSDVTTQDTFFQDYSHISFGDITFQSCLFGDSVSYNIEHKGAVTLRNSTFFLSSSGVALNVKEGGSLSLEGTQLESLVSEDRARGQLWLADHTSKLDAKNSSFTHCYININGTEYNNKIQQYRNELLGCQIVNSTITVQTSALVIQDSFVSESGLNLLSPSFAKVFQTIIQDTFVDVNDSSIDIENSLMSISTSTISSNSSFAIQLRNSSLILHNTTTLNYQTEAISCLDSLSSVLGDYAEWNVSANCVLEFVPLRLDEHSSDVTLAFNGKTTYFEVNITQMTSGFNLTLDIELNSKDKSIIDSLKDSPRTRTTMSSLSSSLHAMSPIANQTFVNIYLLPGACTFNKKNNTIVIIEQDNEFLQSSITDSFVGSIAFDGPSPVFMKPSLTNTTVYCVVTNSSFVNTLNTGLMRVSVQFLKRNLTTATLEFRPGGVAIYTKEMALEYKLFDQWGDPFANSDASHPLVFSSSMCDNGVCGYTYTGLTSAERALAFNFSSWNPVTKVSVSLPPYQLDPATYYCNAPIIICFLYSSD